MGCWRRGTRTPRPHVHPNDRRRVVRALELAEAGHSLRGTRLWSTDWRHPTLVVGLDVPTAELDRRIAERTRAMFAEGVVSEVRNALEAAVVDDGARRSWGCARWPSFLAAEAESELAARTRRLAAYQRKWMRRLPGLVTVRADRSPGEVADDILALARGRQRVPAGREG